MRKFSKAYVVCKALYELYQIDPEMYYTSHDISLRIGRLLTCTFTLTPTEVSKAIILGNTDKYAEIEICKQPMHNGYAMHKNVCNTYRFKKGFVPEFQ